MVQNAALAEFERDILRQRVNAGLEAARRRARLGGRPKSLTEADLKKARALLRSGDYTKGQVAAAVSVYCTTSFSVCSRRRTKMPIIYPDLRLDYKVATQLTQARRTG
jgi:DNA invertase Pin-like site-specific DNA recombinase